MLFAKKHRRRDRGRVPEAVAVAALLFLGAGLAPAAASGGTALAGCQAAADYGSRTIRVTWQTTAEQPDDEILLDRTTDNGANWEPADAAIADGSPKTYESSDDWQPTGTTAGYRVTVLDATTLEEGASVTCAVEIAAAAPAPQPAAPVTADQGAPALTQPLASVPLAGVSQPAVTDIQVSNESELSAAVQPAVAQPSSAPAKQFCVSFEHSAAAQPAARPAVTVPPARKVPQPPGVAGAVAAMGALIGGAGLLVWRRDVR